MRCYSLNAKELTVAANLEVFSIYNKVSNGTPTVKVKRINFAPANVNAATAAQTVEFIFQILGPTPTQNTTGAVLTTPWKFDLGDSPALSVCYVGATALSTGTVVLEWDDGFYYFNGREAFYLEQDIVVPPGYLFRVYCVNAPIGTPTINVDIEFTEEGK